MEKEKFSFYRDWKNCMKGLPVAQKLELYDAIVDYGLDGLESAKSPIVKMAMVFIKGQIDRNDETISKKKKRSINSDCSNYPMVYPANEEKVCSTLKREKRGKKECLENVEKILTASTKEPLDVIKDTIDG